MGDELMAQVSRVLRNYLDTSTGRKGYGFWCPGCECMHYIATDGGPSPVWQFDDNLDAPTFTPSLRIFIPAMEPHGEYPARPEQTLCHLYVKEGQIEYLADSSDHELRGFVPMTDLDTIKNYGWGYE